MSRAFLVILQTPKDRTATYLQESLEEMKELAFSATMQVVGQCLAKVHKPSPSHFVRSGKLQEIALEAKRVNADLVIFNLDLSPVQARNIEAFMKVKEIGSRVVQIRTMDRTALILDIFGKRAKSKAGKLQVELAQLQYKLPRLGGLGGVMSRLGGGVGTRGPGEQELEHDRRKTRIRIQRVKEELKKVSNHRELIRSGRKKKNFLTIALVGYTNAGKSTLLNALTGADTYVKDKLFSTLDPKTRAQNISGRDNILFVDTVGFLKNLPHGLVESFHATLEGVSEADALIHVLDVSHEHPDDFKRATEAVLEEIHASRIPSVLALNKADLLSEEKSTEVLKRWPDGVLISAKEKMGIRSLLAKVMSRLEGVPDAPQKNILNFF